jgi:hypothetical protein
MFTPLYRERERDPVLAKGVFASHNLSVQIDHSGRADASRIVNSATHGLNNFLWELKMFPAAELLLRPASFWRCDITLRLMLNQ